MSGWKLAPELRDHVVVPSLLERDACVPCGKCHLCCQGFSAVMILESHGDDPAAFDTMTLPEMGDIQFLKFKENGDCIYLGSEGCTIHGRAPFMCRVFDCREQHKMYTKAQREVLVEKGLLKSDVLRRGAIMLHQAQKKSSGDDCLPPK